MTALKLTRGGEILSYRFPMNSIAGTYSQALRRLPAM
jgi:hypothetical protein